jgi:hypothetical protein
MTVGLLQKRFKRGRAALGHMVGRIHMFEMV